jgi:hypothetical protein
MSLLINSYILILTVCLDWTNWFIELNRVAISNGQIVVRTPGDRSGSDTVKVAEAVQELQEENARLTSRAEALSKKITALRSRSEGKIGGILS